jgi:hypothetical protein
VSFQTLAPVDFLGSAPVSPELFSGLVERAIFSFARPVSCSYAVFAPITFRCRKACLFHPPAKDSFFVRKARIMLVQMRPDDFPVFLALCAVVVFVMALNAQRYYVFLDA